MRFDEKDILATFRMSNETHSSQVPDDPPAEPPVSSIRSLQRRQHRKSKKLEHVNTWDVPEFMRGAKPRADPSEREAFERHSFAVYQAENAARADETVAYEFERNIQFTQKFSADVAELQEMFPSLELAVIQEIYFNEDAKREKVVEQLLVLASTEKFISCVWTIFEL